MPNLERRPAPGPCNPTDVVAYLEARFRSAFERQPRRIVPSNGKVGVHVTCSSGLRYANDKVWFFKVSERALLANHHIAIWSDWTQTGWIVPSDLLLGFLSTMPPSTADGGTRWDPRIKIGPSGGELWLAREKGVLDISSYEVRFSETSELYDAFPKPKNIEIINLGNGAALPEISSLHEEALLLRAARGASNTRLGLLGELAVIDNERTRLASMGLNQLADKVRHVSLDRNGDMRDEREMTMNDRPGSQMQIRDRPLSHVLIAELETLRAEENRISNEIRESRSGNSTPIDAALLSEVCQSISKTGFDSVRDWRCRIRSLSYLKGLGFKGGIFVAKKIVADLTHHANAIERVASKERELKNLATEPPLAAVSFLNGAGKLTRDEARLALIELAGIIAVEMPEADPHRCILRETMIEHFLNQGEIADSQLRWMRLPLRLREETVGTQKGKYFAKICSVLDRKFMRDRP